jgi:hypothetical protein
VIRRAAVGYFGLVGLLLVLAWWRWARRDLQHKDPLHADLPKIIERVSDLEAAAKRHLGYAV